jgi:hypothetical protein
VYPCMCVCMSIRVHIRMDVCTYVRIYACMLSYMYIRTYACMFHIFREMVNIFSLYCLIELVLFFLFLYIVGYQIAVLQFLYGTQLNTLFFFMNEQQRSETRQIHCASSWQLMCRPFLLEHIFSIL